MFTRSQYAWSWRMPAGALDTHIKGRLKDTNFLYGRSPEEEEAEADQQETGEKAS